MRYRILPYKQGSKSAKALANALGGKVLKLEGSKFKPKADDLVINWGNTNLNSGPIGGYYFYNPQIAVAHVANKLLFFEHMKVHASDVIPQFWTTGEDVPDDAFPVVCRTILSGHSGTGIVMADNRDELVPAQLYTKYEKKKDEYRVHLGKIPYKQTSLDVMGDPDECTSVGGYTTTTIAIQRKARRVGQENIDWRVRNLAGGFVYVRHDVNPPACVTQAASKAFLATGLDFGACDVIYNQVKDRALVLEINSAPGLEGQTVHDYAQYFKSIGGGHATS